MSKKKQTSRKKTEELIPKERKSLVRDALPDDPIFTRGFIIGGRYPSRRPRGSGDEKKEKSDG